jgi:ornithine cyclodeaminase/alanine dehydrogenase-like protein (mu-crystallin family)
MNIAAKLFDESHIRGGIGELVLAASRAAVGRRHHRVQSLGMAVEDVVAADLVFRRASKPDQERS